MRKVVYAFVLFVWSGMALLRAQSTAEDYVEKGRRLLSKDFRQALHCVDTALALGYQAQPIEKLVILESYWIKASAYRLLGQYDSSHWMLDSAALYMDSSNVQHYSTQLMNRGNLYSSKGQLDEALQLYLDGIVAVKDLRLDSEDSLRLFTLYTNTASIYRRSKVPEKAIRMIWRGLLYLPKKHQRSRVGAYINIGNVYTGLNQQDSARWYFYRVLEQPDSVRTIKHTLQAYINLANSYGRDRQAQKAAAYAEKSLVLAHQLNSTTFLKYAYAIAASAAGDLGQLPKSDSLFERAAYYARSLNDTATLLNILSDQAEIEEALGNYKEQFEHQHALLQLARQWNQSEMLQRVALIERDFIRQRQEEEREKQEEALKTQDALIEAEQWQNALMQIFLVLLGILIAVVTWRVSFKARQKKRLKALIQAREADLYERNALLLEYAHLNSHQVRAPLSTFLALIQLLELEEEPGERAWIYAQLREVGEQLGERIAELSRQIAKQQPSELKY